MSPVKTPAHPPPYPQEEYVQLQQKYAELKERKIQDLDTMLQEHNAKLAAHNETAVKLADHWRQEAHRQAAFAQAAGSPAMQVQPALSLFISFRTAASLSTGVHLCVVKSARFFNNNTCPHMASVCAWHYCTQHTALKMV